jgi:hypothetical protein
MENKYKIDKSKLTPDQRNQLDTYYQTQDLLKTLQDLADMTHELVNLATDNKENTDQIQALGAVLTDTREQLIKLNAKEDPAPPEVAKPIIAAINKLEIALKAIKPPQVSVSAPNIPAPDLTEFNRILRKDIPSAFEKAIRSMPKIDLPKVDNGPLLKAWEGISEQLVSIENATRMKPIPGSMKVTTTTGGSVADVNLKQSNTILFATISASGSGDNAIVAAVASKKIKVLSCALVASGTVSVKWRSGTTDVSGAMPLVVNSGFVLPASSPGQGHYLETAVNTALNINLSGAVQVSGHISYYLEA